MIGVDFFSHIDFKPLGILLLTQIGMDFVVSFILKIARIWAEYKYI